MRKLAINSQVTRILMANLRVEIDMNLTCLFFQVLLQPYKMKYLLGKHEGLNSYRSSSLYNHIGMTS